MGRFFVDGNRSSARLDDDSDYAEDAPRSLTPKKRPRHRCSPTASSLPPLRSAPCRHYLLALSSALLSLLGFAGALAAGLGCSFLSVTYADDDSALALAGWEEGEEDGWTYDFGPQVSLDEVLPTHIGLFCNDHGGGKAATLSKAFLSVSLALGFLLLLLAAGVSTFLPVSFKLWNGISALSVVTFIAELPTLLMFDSASCKSPGASCCLSIGSIPLFVSMVAYVMLAILTQWKERPDWREECQLWRLTRESARKRPDGVERDQTEDCDFDEERGIPQMAGEENYAALSDRMPTQPRSEPPTVKRVMQGRVEKMNLLSHDDLAATDTDAIVILSELNDPHEENRVRISNILRDERLGTSKGALDERLAMAKDSVGSRNEPPLRYVSIEDQSVNRSVATSETTLLARGSSPARAAFHAAAAPATPPRGSSSRSLNTSPAVSPLSQGSHVAGRVASPCGGILTPENVSPLSGGSDGAHPPVYESESDKSGLDRFGMEAMDGRRRSRRRSAEEVWEERQRQQQEQQQQQSSVEEVTTTNSGGSDGVTRDLPGAGYDTSDLGRFGMETGEVGDPNGAGAEASSQQSSIDDKANAYESKATNEAKSTNFDGGNTATATSGHDATNDRREASSPEDTVEAFRQAFHRFDEAGSSFGGNGEFSLASASFADEAFGEDVFGGNSFRDLGLDGGVGGDVDWIVNNVIGEEKEATANGEHNEADNANVTSKTQRKRESAASRGIDGDVVRSQRKAKKDQRMSYSRSTATEENSYVHGDARQPVTFSQESMRQMSLAKDVASRMKESNNKSYERKDESFAYESVASDNSSRQKAKKEQQAASTPQEPMPPQTYSTKEAAALQHFDELSVASSAASNQSNATPSGSKRRLRMKIPSCPPSVLPSSQSFSSASTNRTSNKTGSGTAYSGKKQGLKKHASIFRRKSKNVVHVILDDEKEGGKKEISIPTKNASPKKTRNDRNPAIRIVSPEKDHDPDIVAYPSESEMSELSLTDYLSSENEHGHVPLIRSSSVGTYSSEDGSSYTDDSNLTDSEELSAVIAGVNKKLQHRLTSGKNRPLNRRRRRRRKGRSYSAVSSVSSSLSGYSSHGSLLDEVIVEEGELNSSNEVARTSGEVPCQDIVPVVIEASPKKKQKVRSKSRGGGRVVQDDEYNSGYESKVSDSGESLSSRAARARRNRILSKRRPLHPLEDPAAVAARPPLSRPMGALDKLNPCAVSTADGDGQDADRGDDYWKRSASASPTDHPDDEFHGMAADRGINDRRPPPAATRMDDESASVGSSANTAAWRARKVRMARLRKVRQSAAAVASAKSENDGAAADAVVTKTKLDREEKVNRATHGGVVLACASDEDSI